MAERKLTREEKKVLYRRLILDAAKNEFIRKGYKEASIAAIMDEAKLGVGTFYNYFASKEEILLCLLAKNTGKVLTHNYILKEVWGSPTASDVSSLRVYMATLRRKIEKSSNGVQYIQTHVGIGYRMLRINK